MVTRRPRKRHARRLHLDRAAALLYTLLQRFAASAPFPGRMIRMPYRRPERPIQPSVQSPCVRNCCLNDTDICLGCGRSLDEILQWSAASTPQREEILQRASLRREELQRRR